MTQVVAKRVAELRKAAGMNQAELGTRMAKIRTGWSRSTVVKLENNNRESLSVTDLFALAVVLEVPPVWLLADPKSVDTVQVAAGVDLEPWAAILWMVGREPLGKVSPSSRFLEARAALVELQRLAQGLGAIRMTEQQRADDHSLLENDRENQDRRQLTALQRPLELLAGWGYPAPEIPLRIRDRARELGVTLPGVED